LGLFTAWNLVALGSVAALLGAVAILVPLAVGALQFAIREGRRDILIRLSVAPLAAAILFAWVIGAFLGLGGHWAPAPWAIVGDWTGTADWPSVQARWVFGSLTGVLAVSLLITSSIAVYQAIQRTRFDEFRFTIQHRLIAVHPLQIARIPGIVTVAAMSIMTVGVLAWGIIANLHATTAFHEYFGPMHTTAFASWIGSLCVFTASSVVSLHSLSSLLPQMGEE
jgi:hypothetical protein